MKKLRVLIACEESQAVCKVFRKLGHDAYSCDLKPCSGGHPEWHLQGSVFDFADELNFDLMIAHPPCTYLTVSGNKWLKDQPARKSGALVGEARREAVQFFLKIANLNIKHIAIENPIGCMSSEWRKPNQIIQPYFFGDEAMKLTALWLKNLPPLKHFKNVDLFNDVITHVDKGEQVTFKSGKKMAKWYVDASKLNSYDRSEIRSKTFNGIAKAMAEQWSEYILNQ